MLIVDFFIVSGSVVVAMLCAIFVNRVIKSKREYNVNLPKDPKSEFNNLIFEKEIALEALGKINQYFGEQKIDSYDKDRLLLKYGKILEVCEERILKLRPLMEMQEIYQYRKQLYSLISNSVSKLDKKLDTFSNKYDSFIDDGDKKKPNISLIQTVLQKTPSIGNKPSQISGKKSLSSLDDARCDLKMKNSDENSLSSSNAKKNAVVEVYSNNFGRNNYDGNNTKKQDLGNLNVDDINKIEKEVLQILKRLEHPHD
jgi:hypothetical protein